MSLRTALQQSKILTFVVLGAFIWLGATLFQVAASFDWYAFGNGDFIGANATGGVAGVLVLAIVLGTLVVLYSEVTESDPAPESWPPSE